MCCVLGSFCAGLLLLLLFDKTTSSVSFDYIRFFRCVSCVIFKVKCVFIFCCSRCVSDSMTDSLVDWASWSAKKWGRSWVKHGTTTSSFFQLLSKRSVLSQPYLDLLDFPPPSFFRNTPSHTSVQPNCFWLYKTLYRHNIWILRPFWAKFCLEESVGDETIKNLFYRTVNLIDWNFVFPYFSLNPGP